MAYYGQQQAWFLDLYKAGLVYRREGVVNWDPVDQTVLANEQVVDGRGWRSGAVVEKRKLNQWFMRITDYADDLIDALKGLDRWPDKVRTMQENWIGRSKGARFRFAFADQAPAGFESGLEVYTTRPDTLYGASFVGIAPERRGEGLGRQLYERFFEDARAQGRTIVRCVTSPANEASVAFHRALGFEVERVATDYDGPGEDRVLFVKRLS